MSTFLFDQIIFGPVKSRRLGVSLGINLLPTDSKVCSFNCIYCECGWTPRQREKKAELPSRTVVAQKLEEKLLAMKSAGKLPDVITFAGNGEPTLHPEFAGIIDDTVQLRNAIAPGCKIAVLSNSSMIGNESVFQALLKVDDNILKLDSAIPETVMALDCPAGKFDIGQTISQLTRFGQHAIIQTMFIRGTFKDRLIDNTTEKELDAWLEAIGRIRPRQVMIYSIARDTPAEGLVKVPLKDLNRIADMVRKTGIDVQVSG